AVVLHEAAERSADALVPRAVRGNIATAVATSTVSSRRTPGPITTGSCCQSELELQPSQNYVRWLWVPAFAGTTATNSAAASPAPPSQTPAYSPAGRRCPSPA